MHAPRSTSLPNGRLRTGLRVALAAAAAAALAASATACGSGDTRHAAGSAGGGQGGSGGAPVGPATTGPASSTSTGTAGGGGGGGGGAFVPTPGDISYQAVSPVPSGELLVFNDWAPLPNSVAAIPAAGGAKTTIFEAYRVWSMGVAPSSRRIAFSCGYPPDVQEQHYGTDIGDAIQQTWLYDPTSETIALLSNGNVNDECHLFGPGESTLYLCRRYDFQADGSNKGYRVGEIALDTKAFTFLTPDVPNELDLSPAVNADESQMLFEAVLIQGAQQHRQLEVEALPPGSPTVVRQDADAPVYSPDYARLAYTDYADGGALYVADADGSNPVKVATEGGTSAAWSPDGTHLAFLVWDDANSCAHIDVAAADGSEADAPVRRRDCSTTGEFITNLAWIGP